jgi:hypothetical protein
MLGFSPRQRLSAGFALLLLDKLAKNWKVATSRVNPNQKTNQGMRT